MKKLFALIGLLALSLPVIATPSLRSHQEWSDLCASRGIAIAACLHKIMRVGAGDNFVATALPGEMVLTRSGVSLLPKVRQIIKRTEEDTARETVLTLQTNQRCRMNVMPQTTADPLDLVETYIRLVQHTNAQPRLTTKMVSKGWHGLEFQTPTLAGRLITDTANKAQLWVACEGKGAKSGLETLSFHITGSARRYQF